MRSSESEGFGVRAPADEQSGWYLVFTKPRQEAIALKNLQDQGYPCYLPMMRIERLRRRVAAIGVEPMFPRYLFIRLDSGEHGKSWSPIRSTPGVSHLVRFGIRPAKVDDRLIDLLREREQRLPEERLFLAGDRVVITEGSLAGVEAIFQTSSAERRAMILLEILSQPVVLGVDTATLRKAD
jgi:transcriptional antiterminator RfaH